MSLSTSLAVSLLVADYACAEHDEDFKSRLLSSTLFMNGITTLLMVTIGVRLLPMTQYSSFQQILHIESAFCYCDKLLPINKIQTLIIDVIFAFWPTDYRCTKELHLTMWHHWLPWQPLTRTDATWQLHVSTRIITLSQFVSTTAFLHFFVFMTNFFSVFSSLRHISLVLSDFNTTSNSTELIYTNNDDVIIYHIQTVRTIQVTLLTPVTPGLRP